MMSNDTNMTPESGVQYLRDLSLQSWNNRLPVVVYLCLLVVVGAVGNVLSFLVYFLRFPDSSTRVFVLTMSVCDLVTNVVGLPLQILTIRYAYDSFDIYLCRSFYIFATIPTQASGFYLVLVAFDRYHRICKPFKKHLSSGQAWKLVAGATGAATLMFVPFTGFYGYHTVDSPWPEVKAVMCWVHDPYRETFYSTAYLFMVGVSFSGGLLLMATFYFLIGMTVFRRRFGRNFSQTNPISPALRGRESGADDVSGTTSEVGCSHATSSTGPSTEPRHVTDSISATAKVTFSTELFTQSSDMTPSRHATAEDTNRPDNKEQHKKPIGSINPAELSNIVLLTTRPEDTSAEQAPHVPTTLTRNICGITKLNSNLNARKSWNGRSLRSRTTLMMAVLTGLYIANWLPHFAMRLVSSDPANTCEDFTDCGMNLYGLCLRSYYLNSAVNAVVYSFCNPRFRLQCRLLFTRRLHRGRH
ncbi:hypothetical protein C0Q70_18796 [Pomacea canaliculata]|uniref:G-protein coupled receptors family 1 profile domain-containing protein n=1 Tax=Pomacea canaliculata TaxID=400727 RepID=A0A2T7NHL3_POMCA|nr:muscarinic acetylcholine receptor M2-like [Pomacea canaliculata]PVD20638.1 hypothetical protein C0Q70_18796 [Pomacea canaliculata]